jgi:DNA-binding NarL/FixJ family response regulator
MTNRQIAQALVNTEGTIANYVRGILLRLSLDSRAQLAVWVARDTLRRSGAGID